MTGTGAAVRTPKYPDTRVLFVYDRHFSSFIERDWKIISRAFPNSELFRMAGISEFIRLRAAVNCADLIFCWFGGRNALAAAFWNRRRKPLVIVAGGYDVSCEPEWGYGTFAHFPQSAMGRWLFRRADRVLAVSQYAAESAVRFAGVPQGRIRPAYHGFDPGAWVADEVARDLDVFSIIGSNPLRKNLPLMLDAAARLPEIHFMILGRLTAAQRESSGIDRLANVELRERFTDAELRNHYSRAKIYLQPSRHEAFGCAVAEAMLMGCIPVVANASAQPEVVGDTGVFAEPLTGAGVVDAVKKAMSLPEEARERTRKRIVEQFPMSLLAGRLVGAIDEVMAERRVR